METIQSYIQPELLALVPVLYIVGIWLKRSEKVHDTKIPLILGIAGMVLALIYTLASVPLTDYHSVLKAVFVAVTQGILCAGSSVYAHQLVRQKQKFNADSSSQPPAAPPQS